MCDIMSIFTISENKTKKFKYTYVKIILINSLHVVINIVLSERLFPLKISERQGFYTFTNLFIVWLNRRQLDSHFCSAFKLLQYPKSHSLRKTQLCTQERMRVGI